MPSAPPWTRGPRGRLTPDQAASIGLVHEVVGPGQLLGAALR